MKQMFITIDSGIGADGFQVEVKEGLASLFSQRYAYGYTASFNRSWASDRKPYVTDIVAGLMTKFDIARKDIILSQGKNAFKGGLVATEMVTDFENSYLIDLK